MAQVGRISGPLLFANLERNGIDLAFRNTLDETQLLYLEVNNGFVGINKDSPGYQLDIAGTTKTTNLIAETSAEIADFTMDSSSINNLTGDINLSSPSIINLSNFETDNIHISDNVISSYRTNSNIDLATNGTGTVELLTSLNVYGDIHSTKDITFDGNITLGDATSDTVSFNSAIESNVVSTDDLNFDLGSPTKKWNELYTNLANVSNTITGNVSLSGIDSLTLRQGNMIYVAENGDDTNVGDHPNGPFKTLKRALDFADASTSGPVTIYIYAGGYEEELPLVVPSNVNVIGEDYRNTFIRPTSADQSKDIFHLNGESTVQNLTITDFYYDSGNDTGYAFRFAPNTVVTTRSPYVQNVTVITKGTTTSASDPRGFASGDAGKGALVDGADVLSASEEAAMLFHSVTFITPGVDALTMTNGVRVEWLNSFSYFANRGLYAVDGVTGHLSTDGSTVKYGAELRSIGSANVYGNYGAVSDGADCLMYLIQHNMAYIGVGKFVDNDPSRVIQSQEISELNSGRIYYQTVDHFGNFRVGDNFEINQETGETNLVLTEADIDSLNGMTVTTNGSTTYIDGNRVETGNIRFRDNTISSLSGDINVTSASSRINLQNDTNISENLSISGNLSFDGSLITVGNESTDTVTFNTDFTQDVIPDVSGAYNLGSLTKTWQNVYLSKANINDVEIQDNQIRSVSAGDLNLILNANGTGIVLVPSNNVIVSERIFVLQDTSLGSASMESLVNSGTSEILGNHSMGDLNTETLVVNQLAQFEEILIDDNYVTTTSSNADLELRASGTGQIRVPNSNVSITNNLTTRDISADTISVQESITSVELIASGNLNIRDNFIQTTLSNSDLELRANGTGIIKTNALVQIDNDLAVNGNLSFSADLSADDLLGVTDISSDQFYAERLHTDDQIEIWDNNIATVVSNSDLELRANGTGGVELEILKFNENVLSTGNDDSSDVDINLTADNISITSTVSLQIPVGTTIERIGNIGDIRFNTDTQIFEGLADAYVGFGGVYSEDRLTSLTVDPFANVIRMIVDGDDNPVDSTKLRIEIDHSAVFAQRIEVDDVSIDANTIRTNVSNSNLELQAGGTGEFVVDDISFKDNTIKNNTASKGILTFSNTGLGKVKFDGTNGVVVPSGQIHEQPIYSDRFLVTNIISVGTTTVIELNSAHGLDTGDSVFISQVESSTDDALENLNTDDSSSPGNHGVVSAPSATRLELAVDTTGAIIGNYVSGTGYLVGRLSHEPPVGDTRWNTESVILETWDGEQYITSAGSFTAITPAEFDDLLLEYTLALG